MKKQNVIKKYYEIKEIFNQRKFYKNEIYTVYYQENSEKYSRIAVFVTKRNGNAVIRNKIKRQVRMMVDEFWDYKKELNLVIVINKNYRVENYNFNRERLLALLRTLLGENNEEKE